MSLEQYVGPEGNLLEMKPEQCHRLLLPSPILSIDELNAIKQIDSVHGDWTAKTIDITYDKGEGILGYENTLDRVCSETSQAIRDGYRVVVLSDRAVSADRVAISSLVACGGVHHHLIRNKERSRIALMIESAEAARCTTCVCSSVTVPTPSAPGSPWRPSSRWLAKVLSRLTSRPNSSSTTGPMPSTMVSSRSCPRWVSPRLLVQGRSDL